jgi:hypothetical protein
MEGIMSKEVTTAIAGLTMLATAACSSEEKPTQTQAETYTTQQATAGHRYINQDGGLRFIVGRASVVPAKDGSVSLMIQDLDSDRVFTRDYDMETAYNLGLLTKPAYYHDKPVARSGFMSAEFLDAAGPTNNLMWHAKEADAVAVKAAFYNAALKERAAYHADKPLPPFLEAYGFTLKQDSLKREAESLRAESQRLDEQKAQLSAVIERNNRAPKQISALDKTVDSLKTVVAHKTTDVNNLQNIIKKQAADANWQSRHAIEEQAKSAVRQR